MRRSIFAAGVLAGILAIGAAFPQTGSYPNEPQLVTYGGGSNPKEGDPDQVQAIYFSVPAKATKPLFLRLYDPVATESGLDQIATPGPNTTTRFTVFGGKGADASRFARPRRITWQEQTVGSVVLRREYGAEPAHVRTWVTAGKVEPSQGELVDGRYVFRLVIEGMSGNDGNLYDIAVSESDRENVAPEGLRIYSYEITARTPPDGRLTELRFRIPDDATQINIGTFDAARAEMHFTQPFQSRPIYSSGQNSWTVDSVRVREEDRGTMAAITLAGGVEEPNDTTYYVTDQRGRPIPFELPVRLLHPSKRPTAVAKTQGATCLGIRFDASGSTDPEGGKLTYRWLFGDGKTGEGVTATHTYEKEGHVVAHLQVFDDSGLLGSGATIPVRVLAKHPPEPRSVWRKVIAADEFVLYDGRLSSGRKWKIVHHEWRFPDGTVAVGEQVTHAFAKPGTYKIVHTVKDDSGHHCDTASEEFEVRVNAPPIAVAGPDQLVTASVVQFDGSASHDNDGDTVVDYLWNFGDGQTGSGAKPTHVFATPGTYTVTLTAGDSSKTIRNTGTSTMQVVVNARPIADAGPELVGAPGQALRFDGSRSVDPDGKIAEYLWDFRDGSTATGERVEHAFAKPGIYKVLLRVKDNTGHDAAIDFSETRVFVNMPPVADAGPAVIAAPGDVVRLSGARSFDPDGRIASYRWDFSDDVAMPGMDVERRFEKPGIYTAKLTVTDDSGAINANTSAEVRIAVNHAPIAAAGENIFTNETIISFDGSKSVDADGDALTYRWDFGDGTSASGMRVTHTYKSGGTYPVVLVVDDGKGLGNSTARDAITVRIDRAPVAVAGENQNACTGDVLVFDGSKSSDPEGSVLRYVWDFGDGSKAEIVNPTKTYKQGGLYPVTLTVRDESGLPRNFSTSRIAVRIDQGPVANAGTSQVLACANNAVTFDGSKSTDVDGVVNSYRWDFGDGNFGGGVRPTHTYEKPGKYRAFLTVQGEKVGNCSPTSTDEIAVEIIAGPVAVIKAPAAAPVTDTVTFDATGSKANGGRITGYQWEFGDGKTATGPRVTHKYDKAGTYRVQLTIASDSAAPSCRSVSTRHLIAVNDPPRAVAKARQLVAADEELVFDATESSDPDGAIVDYVWDFGDGGKGSGVIARHTYRKPGVYRVKLAVHDNAGLPNSVANAEIAVTVNAPPAPVISGPEVACVREAITWASEKSSDPDGKIASVRWSFGDGADATTASAVHRYRAPGRYSLTLYADDGAGLANSRSYVTRSIWVNQPPLAAAGSDRIVCPGDVVKFDGSMSSDPDGKLTRYRWEFGDGNARDGMQVEHRFAKAGTYRVRLTVTDDSTSSCATNAAEVTVLVKATPIARAGGDREVWVGGAHDTVLLDGSGSSDPDGMPLTYAWRIGDGISALGRRVLQAIPSAGKYPATLTVSDPSGLSCGTATDSFVIDARERK